MQPLKKERFLHGYQWSVIESTEQSVSGGHNMLNYFAKPSALSTALSTARQPVFYYMSAVKEMKQRCV